jgi:hypothetical protein
MATVQGIRERIGQPVMDAFRVPPGKQLREIEAGSTLKFFVNVQGKTKLETNLQSASLLPHYNTFEARTMRVVISDLPPEFSDEAKSKKSKEFDVTDGDGNKIDTEGQIEGAPATTFDPTKAVLANLEVDLKRLMELLEEARASADPKETTFAIDEAEEKGVSLFSKDATGNNVPFTAIDPFLEASPVIILTVRDIEEMILSLEKKAPPLEQIRPNDGAGNIISKFIFSTVTTLFVGEKIMIEMPTWFFPGGAGPYSFTNKTISHGEPSPLATFRFAEAVFIDKQQNFRVEIDIPDSDVHKSIQQIYGPLFIWVVLDGYLTRDVQ